MERTHGPHGTAWWVNGIQLKLGLLGKVIGFSMLALQIGQIQNFDPAQSQELLKSLTAGLGVALAVWVLRNKLRRFLPVGLMNVLDQPLVAFSLPIVVSFFGGLGTAAMAGPLTWPIVGAVALGAIKTGAGAAFTFLLGSNVRETAKPPAPLPSTTGEAVAAFNKGPQP